MLHFINLDDFLKFLFFNCSIDYNNNNIHLQFSYLFDRLFIQNMNNMQNMYIRCVYDQLFSEITYKIINSECQLTPNVQIALLIIDYIIMFNYEKTDNIKTIMNNDFSIDIKFQNKEGSMKNGKILYKKDGIIEFTKYNKFKNSVYNVKLC